MRIYSPHSSSMLPIAPWTSRRVLSSWLLSLFNLMLLGVSGLKAALDFVDLVAAMRKRWGLISAKHGQDVDVDDEGKTMSLVVLDVDVRQRLLEVEQELDDDVLESVPGLDDSVPTMMVEKAEVSALALAYAAMSGELPWDDEDWL